MRIETVELDKEKRVTLTAYIQDIEDDYGQIIKRPGVIILPGGAYINCSEREADPVAAAYLKAGYQAFILRYSVGEHAVWPAPLEDYEQAMIMIRTEADRWNLYPDKIAVIGFSAGGHLAAAAATMSKNRPNAAVLGYAAAGEAVKDCNPSAPNTIAAVDEDTCPCFLFATRNDAVVPVCNTLEFAEALGKYDISFECHIYAYGPHGVSTVSSAILNKDTEICSRVSHWVQDSIDWLTDVLGEVTLDGIKEAVCKKHVTGNRDRYLSLRCTIGYLSEHPLAKELMESVLNNLTVKDVNDSGREIPVLDIVQYFKNETLANLLHKFNIGQKKLDEIDKELSKISN